MIKNKSLIITTFTVGLLMVPGLLFNNPAHASSVPLENGIVKNIPSIQADTTNTNNFQNTEQKTFEWQGLTLTLDSSGILHIPGGEITTGVHDDVSLFDVEGMIDIYKNIKQISLDGKLTIHGSASGMFGCNYDSNPPLSEIKNLNNLITNDVTDMSYMFYRCSNVKEIDTSRFNTSKVTDMRSMFAGDRSATYFFVNDFNTSKVTNMGSMFMETKASDTLLLNNFDTSNVTDMSQMFASSGVEHLDVSSFDTSNVTDMTSMFVAIKSEVLDLENFDTSNVTHMELMLGDSHLKQLSLGEKFHFIGGTAADLPEAPMDEHYTGNWINILTLARPWTAKDLMINYNGNVDAGTYIWEEVQSNV